MNIILPKPIILFIDSYRYSMSRATFIIKCVDYVMRNNIDINLYYNNLNNESNDDQSKKPFKKGEGRNFDSM